MKLKTVLRAMTAAAVLTGAANVYAVPDNQLTIPWQGIIDLGNGSPYDVYYQVFADPNNTLCSNGPLTCTFLGSPIIAKQDGEFTPGPAYTGQEFDVEIGSTATAGDPGYCSYELGGALDQHFVTAWVTKDGSPDLLTIFWLVADGTTLGGDTSYTGIQASPGSLYPWWAVNTCTDGKTAQPDGEDQCKPGGLSNMVWYNSGGGNPPEEIPEPGLLGLLGLALGGLGIATRRRRS